MQLVGNILCKSFEMCFVWILRCCNLSAVFHVFITTFGSIRQFSHCICADACVGTNISSNYTVVLALKIGQWRRNSCCWSFVISGPLLCICRLTAWSCEVSTRMSCWILWRWQRRSLWRCASSNTCPSMVSADFLHCLIYTGLEKYLRSWIILLGLFHTVFVRVQAFKDI